MTDRPNRRKFLQWLGLSAGTALAGHGALAAFIDKEEIRKLNPDQQAFLMRYGEWMEQFIVMSRVKKKDPGNADNNRKLMALAEEAEAMRPELVEHMKDETFSVVYKLSIERASKEI
jgi:hypothetical protein